MKSGAKISATIAGAFGTLLSSWNIRRTNAMFDVLVDTTRSSAPMAVAMVPSHLFCKRTSALQQVVRFLLLVHAASSMITRHSCLRRQLTHTTSHHTLALGSLLRRAV